jgi:hypothetical protein
MATNPAGAGTKTVGINMLKEEAEYFEERAACMGISTGLYMKVILRMWKKSKCKLVLNDGKMQKTYTLNG